MKIQLYGRDNVTAVKVGVSRQVVIPKNLHDNLGLKPGDYLEVREQSGKVVMTPKVFIDKQILGAFQESINNLKHGHFSGPFSTATEAIRSLHKHKKNSRSSQAKKK
jgi:AbrB family looped-hinge helix DNA binding protein